jgi:hypothetical protein
MVAGSFSVSMVVTLVAVVMLIALMHDEQKTFVEARSRMAMSSGGGERSYTNI